MALGSPTPLGVGGVTIDNDRCVQLCKLPSILVSQDISRIIDDPSGSLKLALAMIQVAVIQFHGAPDQLFQSMDALQHLSYWDLTLPKVQSFSGAIKSFCVADVQLHQTT